MGKSANIQSVQCEKAMAITQEQLHTAAIEGTFLTKSKTKLWYSKDDEKKMLDNISKQADGNSFAQSNSDHFPCNAGFAAFALA